MLRRRARTLVAAREVRWAGVLFIMAGATLELFGASKNRAGLGVLVAGGLIIVLGQLMLIVLRRRHPDDDPDELVKIWRNPNPAGSEQTTPPPATPGATRTGRRRWHDVRIPAGSRYINKGHANDLAERRLLRRAGALISAVTVLGCGIAASACSTRRPIQSPSLSPGSWSAPSPPASSCAYCSSSTRRGAETGPTSDEPRLRWSRLATGSPAALLGRRARPPTIGRNVLEATARCLNQRRT